MDRTEPVEESPETIAEMTRAQGKAKISMMPTSVHQQMEISLYNVAESSYSSLQLVDISYPYWIISYVRSGEVLTMTGGEQFVARSGDVMIHPPHLPFSEVSASAGTHLWLGLDVSVSSKLDLFRFYPVQYVVTLQSAELYCALFRQLSAVWGGHSQPARDYCGSAYALAMISHLLESWAQAGSQPRAAGKQTDQDRFNQIIYYMMEHLDSKLTRKDLADLLHLHPVYLDRAFVACYGITPIQMLRQLRLKQVKQLLESGMLSLSGIAAACGFNDAAHLSHQFMRSFGFTPGEYREQVKQVMRGYLT